MLIVEGEDDKKGKVFNYPIPNFLNEETIMFGSKSFFKLYIGKNWESSALEHRKISQNV